MTVNTNHYFSQPEVSYKEDQTCNVGSMCLSRDKSHQADYFVLRAAPSPTAVVDSSPPFRSTETQSLYEPKTLTMIQQAFRSVVSNHVPLLVL